MSSTSTQNLEKERETRYFTAEDVEDHCTLADCWVSIFGRVLNLSEIILENGHSTLINPLLKAAGSDISHWFDAKTQRLKTKIDADLGKKVFVYPPEGRFLHGPPNKPISDDEPIAEKPWWENENFIVGKLT